MQKISCYSGNAINFLKKGITLSLFISLNLAAYSNPMDENSERTAGYNFLSGKSLFTSFEHYLKNNPPEEASNAPRIVAYFYTLSLVPDNANALAKAGSGNFPATVRRYQMPIVV